MNKEDYIDIEACDSEERSVTIAVQPPMLPYQIKYVTFFWFCNTCKNINSIVNGNATVHLIKYSFILYF